MKYLAVDIGGTFIKYALINRSGNIVTRDKQKTPNNLDALIRTIEALIENKRDVIKGIGISAPGRIDMQTGMIYNGGSLLFLHKVNLRKYIEEKYNIPCAVSNDGKAAALAEVWLGNLNEIDNGAAIVLGTGVGGGIIINGELIQGSNFQAGELSFLFRYPGDASNSNMIGYTGSAVLFIEKAASLLNLQDKNDGITVFEEINKNENEKLVKLFEEYCREIAFIILNLQATLDIRKVVIGGGISSQPVLIENIIEQYRKIRKTSSLLSNTFKPIQIEACKFKNDANLLGATYQLFLQMENN